MKLDRVSGATTVAGRAFGYLEEWLQESKNRSLNFFLAGMENRGLKLLRDYPAMGNVYSLINDIGIGIDRAAKRNADKTGFVWEIVRQMKGWQRKELRAIQAIPGFAAEVIGPGKTILTLSSSELVRETILGLKSREVKAIVLESRPLREGERTAFDLARAGIPTLLIVDVAFPSLEKEADAVLIGADRIDRTLVNKVGTRALLEWANRKKKPVFVVCQTSKIVPPSWCVLPLPNAPAKEVSILGHPKLTVRNFYFEECPLDLATSVITERKVLNCEAIRKKATSVETSGWFRQLLKKAAGLKHPL